MRTQPFTSNPLATGIMKAAIIGFGGFALGGIVVFAYEPNGFIWGVAIIAVTFVVEGLIIVNALTHTTCPNCRRPMKRELSEKSFKCGICGIDWQLPQMSSAGP